MFCHFFSHSLEYYSRAYGNAAADRPQLASRGRRSAACARAFVAAGGPRLPSRRTRHPHALRRRHAHRVSPSKSFKLSKINFAAAALSSRSQLLSTHVLLLVISVCPPASCRCRSKRTGVGSRCCMLGCSSAHINSCAHSRISSSRERVSSLQSRRAAGSAKQSG